MKTGSRIPKWQPPVSETGSSYISRRLEYFIEIWYGNISPVSLTSVTNRKGMKCGRKTANINVKIFRFITTCKVHRWWHI